MMGLIFTRSREGTQPSGLTQTGQTEQSIRYHAPSCLVLSRGAGRAEVNCSLEVRWAAGGERVLLCVFCCFCIFFLSVVLLLLLVSFAILLICPYPDAVFPFSSDSPPHPSGGRGDRATA